MHRSRSSQSLVASPWRLDTCKRWGAARRCLVPSTLDSMLVALALRLLLFILSIFVRDLAILCDLVAHRDSCSCVFLWHMMMGCECILNQLGSRWRDSIGHQGLQTRWTLSNVRWCYIEAEYFLSSSAQFFASIYRCFKLHDLYKWHEFEIMRLALTLEVGLKVIC